jgi:hypothetical protein
VNVSLNASTARRTSSASPAALVPGSGARLVGRTRGGSGGGAAWPAAGSRLPWRSDCQLDQPPLRGRTFVRIAWPTLGILSCQTRSAGSGVAVSRPTDSGNSGSARAARARSGGLLSKSWPLLAAGSHVLPHAGADRPPAPARAR